jgi:Ca2+-binding RTX toxin-like protein
MKRATLLAVVTGLLLALMAGVAVAENFDGTPKDDTIRGTAQEDSIDGRGGDDRLFGFGKKDNIKGGDGNDRIDGGAGNDIMSGGAGNDVIQANDGIRDRVFCGSGRDLVIKDLLDKVESDCETERN